MTNKIRLESDEEGSVNEPTLEELVGVIRSKKRTEISIGPGVNTLPNPDREDTCYICFDRSYFGGNNDYLRDCLQSHNFSMKEVKYLADKGVLFSNIPGEDTGLPDSCADIIKISNVLNDPNAYHGAAIIAESKRILKPKGAIYVAATNTPENFLLTDLVKLSRDLGLKSQTLCSALSYNSPSVPLDEVEARLFEHVDDRFFPGNPVPRGSYLVKLTKFNDRKGEINGEMDIIRLRLEALATIDSSRFLKETGIKIDSVRDFVERICDVYDETLREIVLRKAKDIRLAYKGYEGLKILTITMPYSDARVGDLAKFVEVRPDQINLADPENSALPIAQLRELNYLADDETYLVMGVTEEHMKKIQFKDQDEIK